MSKSKDINTKPLSTWGIATRDSFAAVQNKVIRVTTLDGKTYVATLLGVDTYDLVLKQNDGAWFLIPKHAVKLIIPANGGIRDQSSGVREQ